MGEKSQQTRDPVSTLFYTMLISSVFWMIFSTWWDFDSALFTRPIDLSGNLSGVTAPAWLLIIWIGVLGSFAPMFFSFIALGHLNATGVGVISTAETVFACLFAYLWLGENMDFLQLIGGTLVIAGIVVAQFSRGKTQ
jgi:drug/metabolite transporter (DMT)-like permease